jgi:hypothetical protein
VIALEVGFGYSEGMDVERMRGQRSGIAVVKRNPWDFRAVETVNPWD